VQRGEVWRAPGTPDSSLASFIELGSMEAIEEKLKEEIRITG